jgi:hypothetical protein
MKISHKYFRPVCGKGRFRPAIIRGMSEHFLSDLPSCPGTFSEALNVTLSTPPLWLKPHVAVLMSSLPRYEIDNLIREKAIRVAWRPNKSGRLMPLIYGPSLWSYLDQLAESGPAGTGPEKEDVVP